MKNTLSSYKIFYEVAKNGSFSIASRQLFISQPAISKAIKKLEDSLSTTLFIRASKGCRLTTEGEILFKYIDSALSSIEAGEEKLDMINKFEVGHLKISASATLCKYILLPYLKEFINDHPHIKITIECHSTTQIIEQLEAGQTDIGLIGRTKDMTSLNFYSLGFIDYIFVATKKYLTNLKKLGEYKDYNIFNNANLMLLDSNNVSRLHVNKYLEKYNIIANNILEVNNMDLLIDFAKIDMGIACVIANFVKKDLTDKRLVSIKLPEKIDSREIGFAYNERGVITKSMQQFIDFYNKKILPDS